MIVGYKMFKVVVRVNGKLTPLAVLHDDLTVKCHQAIVLSLIARKSFSDFVAEMEEGLRDDTPHDSKKFASRMGESLTRTSTNDGDHALLILHRKTKSFKPSALNHGSMIFTQNFAM